MKIIFCISIIALFVFGCKKYPDDQSYIHFRTPNGRLNVYSKWKLTEYMVNGDDSISYINSQVWAERSLDKISFSFNSTDQITINEAEVNGNFIFKNKKREVLIGYTPNANYTYPLFLNGNNLWKIIRLERGELILELNKNSKSYKLKFIGTEKTKH